MKKAIIKKVKRFLFRVYVYFTAQRISLFKTLYFNLRMLPFSQAIKLPIYIYGKVKFYDLFGSIEIKSPIHRGMIKFGYRQGLFSAEAGSAMIHVTRNAKIIFNGPCLFDYDYAIRVTGNGVLNIGAYIGFGSGVKFYCNSHIIIGNNCRIPYGCCFQDSNYHYSIDLQNNRIGPKNGEIIIGDFNWIGNSCYITKGTITTAGCIIGAHSYLNKNYKTASNNTPNLLIVGSPAKIIREGVSRIFPLDIESELDNLWETNPNIPYVNGDKYLDRYQDVAGYHKLF